MMPQLLNDEQHNLNRHDASTTKRVARIATMKKVGVDAARTTSRPRCRNLHKSKVDMEVDNCSMMSSVIFQISVGMAECRSASKRCRNSICKETQQHSRAPRSGRGLSTPQKDGSTTLVTGCSDIVTFLHAQGLPVPSNCCNHLAMPCRGCSLIFISVPAACQPIGPRRPRIVCSPPSLSE